MDDSVIWKMIDIFFRDNPQSLVRHHIDSYNQFYREDFKQMIREMNPIKLEVDYDEKLQEFRSQCLIYIGGKDGSKIYLGKPIVNETSKDTHYMIPNECRLRNMTYAMTIHYDVEVEYTRILRETDIPTKLDANGYAIYDDSWNEEEGDDKKQDEKNKLHKKDYTPTEMAKLRENTTLQMDGNIQKVKILLEKIFLGRFPIMLQSEFCILHQLPREMRFNLGECKNDLGGYFIIDGKEKTVVPQEEFGDNMMKIFKGDDHYSHILDMKSVSENVSKPIRNLSIKITASKSITESKKPLEDKNIVVFLPDAGNKGIPLFVLFRALGIISDKEIISFCTLRLPENTPIPFITYFESSIHDASSITTQQEALQYISLLVKGRSITRTMLILADYFLPHVGEVNFIEKAYHLGYLVNRLLLVETGLEPITDRDSYKYKRLALIGPLMKKLFREYYTQQQIDIKRYLETKYYFGRETYADLSKLIYTKYTDAFRIRNVEEGFQKAFKGRWGSNERTKVVGLVQDLNRISFNAYVSHLRKTNLPMDPSVKLVGPRILHGSQWGLLDPIDTPDGANIGLHKHLSIMTLITNSLSREPMIHWIRNHFPLKNITECRPEGLWKLSKVFVNGYWTGCSSDPVSLIKTLKLHRRQGLIPITTSITYDYSPNNVLIHSDGGRLCRPLFYRDEFKNSFAFQEKDSWELICKRFLDSSEVNLWNCIISGFREKKQIDHDIYKDYSSWEKLYQTDVKDISESKSIVEYLDTQETETSFIAMNTNEISKESMHTHCEIHPSTTYGVMSNLINYLEHNPVTRNSFSCGQSKQAVSLYSTNYQLRMDKTAVVLNYGQIPLVKTRFFEHVCHEENPYGENAIVAVMCYTGYNVEDAILINESAVQRGLFRTTYYSTYEAEEEKDEKNGVVIRKKVIHPFVSDTNTKAVKQKNGETFDYSFLNEYGLLPENTEVHDNMILIGKSVVDAQGVSQDQSIVPKKGQVGVVDKSFITDDEEGQRIAKVKIREERIPSIGDKFASRAGQKGTIGMVIPEANMPFTKDGIRPDIIVNPHAFPSRMTIGQIVECLVGKTCVYKGTFGDCTAYLNRENKIDIFGELLNKYHYHSNGEEIMYDGMTGKQLEASIFIGPTYYMRLKHMVKDKINHRARGHRQQLTRQPVSGRANDGGLRIGEMEKDAVISHGMSQFLKESLMDRADGYQLAICNHSGMMAIYNPAKDLLLSPIVDGPLRYTGSLDKEGAVELCQITKYGRSFSIVQIPYSLKLLIQELQAINVHMRIITEDNITQITNLNFACAKLDVILDDPNATTQKLIHYIQERLTPENNVQNDVELPKPKRIKKDMEEEEEQETKMNSIPEERQKKNFLSSNKDEVEEILIDYKETEETQDDIKESNMEEKSGGSLDMRFMEGQEVRYIGDSKPNRVWTVLRKGNRLYTIETEDLGNDLSVEDARKVVSPDDIREQTVYDERDELENRNKESTDDKRKAISEKDIVPNGNIPSFGYSQEHPSILFAPVIKVFNDGNDMSAPPIMNDKIPSEIMSIVDTNPISIPYNRTEKMDTEKKETPEEIDFNKPIIKKE